jgi:hypothetical protein
MPRLASRDTWHSHLNESPSSASDPSAMKRIILVLLLALSVPSTSKADDVRVSFDFFYETLAPYGEGFSVEGYGYVWRPANVTADWAPYTDGYWAYTDAGWTWVSYEDWGPITYHYGRWIVLRDYGWCWVPGYDWGPAWVSWRTSDEYIGWAPLPPEARWQVDTGFGTWVDAHYEIGPSAYSFCRVRDFGSPVIRNVLLPPPWNVTFIERTRNVTNITWREDHGCVFNGGLEFAWVAPLVARPLPTLRLVRNTRNVIAPGRQGNVLMSARSGQTLYVGAPPVAPGASRAPQQPPRVSRNVAAPIIDRGWAGPAQDPARERIAAKFRQEIQGATPQTAPARPFHPDLVAMVPKPASPASPAAASTVSPARAIGRAPSAPPQSLPPPAQVPSPPIEAPARNKTEQRPPPPLTPPPGIDSQQGARNRATEMNAVRQRQESMQRLIEIQHPQKAVVAPTEAPRQPAPPVKIQPTAPPLALPPRTQPPPPPTGGPLPPPDPNRPPPPPDPRRRGP